MSTTIWLHVARTQCKPFSIFLYDPAMKKGNDGNNKLQGVTPFAFRLSLKIIRALGRLAFAGCRVQDCAYERLAR